jgi:hypothetical protein
MGRSLLETSGYYDPDTFCSCCAVPSTRQEEIANSYRHMSVEERRTRLALIILEIANNRDRDLDDIKETALEFMRLKERPARFNRPQT